MKQSLRVYQGLMAMLLGLGSCAAMAGSSSAELSWQWRLTDLDPEDGIAAGIEFFPRPGGVYTAQLAANGSETGLGMDGQYDQRLSEHKDIAIAEGLFIHDAVSVVGERFEAHAKLETHDGIQFLSASGSARPSRDPLGGSTHYNAGADAPFGFSSWYFVLSPNTAVTFFGQASLSAITEAAHGIVQTDLAGAAYVLNAAGRPAGNADWDWTMNQTSAKSVSVPTLRYEPGTNTYRYLTQDEWSGDIEVALYNGDTTPMIGALNAYVRVDGYMATVVPEPGALPLVVAGGGLVWLVARRRGAHMRLSRRA